MTCGIYLTSNHKNSNFLRFLSPKTSNMSLIALTLFWVIWLIDVLITLYGYREFIQGVFGQYAAPTSKYISMWIVLFLIAALVIGGSLYFKNQGNTTMAFSVAALPLVVALPYALWLAVVLISGKNARWN